MVKRLEFLQESLKNLKTVGSVARSSSFLCESMISYINFSEAQTIVELGAGDGVITRQLLRNMRPDAKLITFEVNEKFCSILRNIDDPRLILIDDSAEKLKEYLTELGLEHIDYVISAIPFTVLPKPIGFNVVGQCYDRLKNGGLFVQMHYSLLTTKLYKTIFGNVGIRFVPLNLPPAFVMVSEKV